MIPSLLTSLLLFFASPGNEAEPIVQQQEVLKPAKIRARSSSRGPRLGLPLRTDGTEETTRLQSGRWLGGAAATPPAVSSSIADSHMADGTMVNGNMADGNMSGSAKDNVTKASNTPTSGNRNGDAAPSGMADGNRVGGAKADGTMTSNTPTSGDRDGNAAPSGTADGNRVGGASASGNRMASDAMTGARIHPDNRGWIMWEVSAAQMTTPNPTDSDSSLAPFLAEAARWAAERPTGPVATIIGTLPDGRRFVALCKRVKTPLGWKSIGFLPPPAPPQGNPPPLASSLDNPPSPAASQSHSPLPALSQSNLPLPGASQSNPPLPPPSRDGRPNPDATSSTPAVYIYSTSVNRIEHLSGYNLFPRLPSHLQEIIEEMTVSELFCSFQEFDSGLNEYPDRSMDTDFETEDHPELFQE